LILSLNNFKVIAVVLFVLFGNNIYCQSSDIDSNNIASTRNLININQDSIKPNILNFGRTRSIIDSSNSIRAVDNKQSMMFDNFYKRLTAAVVISGLVIVSILVVIVVYFFVIKVHGKSGFRLEIKKESGNYENIQIPDLDIESNGEDRSVRQIMKANSINYDEAAVLLSLNKK
jgi:hypothetical protein